MNLRFAQAVGRVPGRGIRSAKGAGRGVRCGIDHPLLPREVLTGSPVWSGLPSFHPIGTDLEGGNVPQPHPMRILILVLGLVLHGMTLAQSTAPVADTLNPTQVATSDALLFLYPNPTASVLHVQWGARSLARMPIEVRGLDGRLVQLTSLSAANELDVSALPEGLYHLLLIDLCGVRARKVFRVQR